MPVVTETTDAAAATATTYSMAVGDYFFGTLGTTQDSDWIRVDLVAGQTYTFGLVGVGALTDNLDDSYLRLRNGAGTLISEDDDSGPGRNSSVTFTASSTGSYYLDVQSWNNSKAGDYGLSVVAGSRASYDVTMGAGVLLRPDVSWAATPGTPATVTWGIRATGPAPGGAAYDGQGNIVPFEALTAAQIVAAREVMSMFEGVSGLTLTQVNPGGTTDNATMLFGAYTSTIDGSGAFAYYPGSTSFSANAGDVWLNNNSISQTSLPRGESFSYFALLHELGHTVGLAHPGDYNAAPGVSITYANSAQFIEDSHQYTVMSYFDESNTTSSFSSYPDTLLLYDIYALQQLYGANYSFQAGNTTYGFNATVGGAYDFTTNSNPFLSIWDGSGTDTLDLSGYTMAQRVDLRAGMFSDIGGYVGNLSIAIGAVIENAIGGSGADRLTGNAAANVLDGGPGADTLDGGLGADTLDGGGGIDMVSYATATGRIGARLDGGVNWGKATGDVFQNIEGLIGGDFDDTLIGSNAADLLQGGGGDDNIVALWGNDTLAGGAGADTLNGGGGADTITYAAATGRIGARLDGGVNWGGATGDVIQNAETLVGGIFDDTLIGSNGGNLLLGALGNDKIYGLGGNDTIAGGAGDDTLYGYGGADVFVYDNGFGTDIIADFEATNDQEKINLAGVSSITDWADLSNPVNGHMLQIGADVVINDLAGNTITLTGVSLEQLHEVDFIF